MPCQPPKTKADKLWTTYDEYYTGERDDDNRKNGDGENHFTRPKQLEWYIGRFLRDTMHGYGDYRLRYVGHEHRATTYEGWFYNNLMHGYGITSYPNGSVYCGTYYKDARWGPGVETYACTREDVGFWSGPQLVRLAWRPSVPSVVIDLASSPVGRCMIEQHRVLLTENVKTLGEVNSALELLKQYGSEPVAATDNWMKLYPKTCTDTSSQLCQVDMFDRAYYGNQITTLEEHSAEPDMNENNKTYYAWNNNYMMIHMMKHCFKHEKQRGKININLEGVLNGTKTQKQPGSYELKCRRLLMACYLGYMSNVAQLVNESDVDPNLADMQGNSALMYAACGDNPEIIHFLVEAGAEVDDYNDACCTPLGVTLLRFALARLDVAPNAALQALLPSTQISPPSPAEKTVSEWHINRDIPSAPLPSHLTKVPSKILKPTLMKSVSSHKSLVINPTFKKKFTQTDGPTHEGSEESFANETRLYNNITTEFLEKVGELYSLQSGISPVQYIFDVQDMIKDVELSDEDQKKTPPGGAGQPKKSMSKVAKDTMKPSRDMLFQGDKEDNLLDTKDQLKIDRINRIMKTILQLLSEGADPRKVRCPQPPLYVATVAGSAELISHLVRHGADINEVYPKALGYTALDMAVSGPLTVDNVNIIRSLLENGANPDHRLQIIESPQVSGDNQIPPDGPTLLHAVMARRVEYESEEDLRCQILKLLLEYGCDATKQYKGRSAIDVAMTKSLGIFDLYIKSPRTNLNVVINDANQTILMKMFFLPYCRSIPVADRLQTLTNLLLFGADPLIKCKSVNEEYDNLFVYANKILSELELTHKPPSPPGSKGGVKKNKSEIKSKKLNTKKEQGPIKSMAKAVTDDYGDYKQTLDLVLDCARLLYIRWLQAKLMKELIQIVAKFKHRHWNMIVKEHENRKCTGLWLTAPRCLEIWDILKTTKKKIYNDDKILNHVLCIIHYYYKMSWNILRMPNNINAHLPKMCYQEKALIELEVANYVHEHKLATMPTPDMVPAIRPYVAPELTVTGLEKFNICFECAMPFTNGKIPCESCKLITFCSLACIKMNVKRINCHPCSAYLKDKYFPTPVAPEDDIDTD